MVPMLRTCGEAEASSASEITGQRSRTAGCAATSLMRAIAPAAGRSASASMSDRPTAFQIDQLVGASTLSFINCMRSLPPAMYLRALRLRGGDRIAREGRLEKRERLHGSALLRGVADRRDDVGIGAAATDISAHPLADFGIGSGMAFLDQCGGRHDLAGRAVAALEAVVMQERRLHRMQFAVRAPVLRSW